MVSLDLRDFNIICAALGVFVSGYGLVSYVVRERWYLSEACKMPPTRASVFAACATMRWN
jgi:hypothetical protein